MKNVSQTSALLAAKKLKAIRPDLFLDQRGLHQNHNQDTEKNSKRPFTHRFRITASQLKNHAQGIFNPNVRNFKISNQEAKLLHSLKFTRQTKPDISIVIPVYNKLGLTIRCLNSIAHQKTNHKYEVIVVDNASNEPVTRCLGSIPNLILQTNKSNLGYVEGCNSGAQKARGKIIVFLNNDTEVLGGWLDELVSPLDESSVGLVGSKLIYPDGSLQEAGGIIFNDASGNNFGKHSSADNFMFNYRCDVDYVSGASIALSKELFDSLGGFDKLYAPAYYEDTDLAFRIRSKGLRVLYAPKSVLVHIEGATAGTDTNSGFKRYQEVNKVKFTKRWKKELLRQPAPDSNIFLARTHNSRHRVLFIDNSVPEPDRDSGSVRQWEILKLLKNLDCHVTFWPLNLVATLPYTSKLQEMGIEVAYGSDTSLETLLKEREGCYTHIFMSRPNVGIKSIDMIKKYQSTAFLVFDTVDLHYLRTERQAATESKPALLKESSYWKTIEHYLIQKSDLTLVVSQTEKQLLNNEGYKKVSVLSNIHNMRKLDASPPFQKRKGLLFIGNFEHTPNVDAMIWFCERIFPKVQESLPKLSLEIIGNKPPEEVVRLAAKPGVTVHGYVEEVAPLFDAARVFISPLRYGAGVKGKIGQSIGLGLPVVTTSIGSEGMMLRDSKDCLLADSEADFAKAVQALYENSTLWQKLRKEAYTTLSKHMSPDQAKKTLSTIVQRSKTHQS